MKRYAHQCQACWTAWTTEKRSSMSVCPKCKGDKKTYVLQQQRSWIDRIYMTSALLNAAVIPALVAIILWFL